MMLRSGRVADEALTAGAVARRLGVAVTTLRTWHQRYGLGPSRHVAGQHRRYTPDDLERLQVMRRLTAQGVSPAEAAAWAKRTTLSPPSSSTPSPSRDGGGNSIATGRSVPAARGLARAAIRLDAPAQRDILEETIAKYGVIPTWNEVILPVLAGISARYAATSSYIEVEHLLSRTVTEVLISIPRPPSTQIPRALLAAADGELHTLPLEALAAALAEAGVATRFLGARMPAQALAAAVVRTGPRAVVVWSQLTSTGNPAQLAHLLHGPHRPILAAVAGPGWPATGLPPGITVLASLEDGVRTISAAVA